MPALPEELSRMIVIPENADRKSTRLNSSHITISYAVFCLKKKKKDQTRIEVQKTGNANKNEGALEQDRPDASDGSGKHARTPRPQHNTYVAPSSRHNTGTL